MYILCIFYVYSMKRCVVLPPSIKTDNLTRSGWFHVLSLYQLNWECQSIKIDDKTTIANWTKPTHKLLKQDNGSMCLIQLAEA